LALAGLVRSVQVGRPACYRPVYRLPKPPAFCGGGDGGHARLYLPADCRRQSVRPEELRAVRV